MSFIQRNLAIGTGGLPVSGTVTGIGPVDVDRCGNEGSRLIVEDQMFTCPVDFTLVINGKGEVELTWNGAEELAEGDHSLLIATAEYTAQYRSTGGGGGGGDANATNQVIGNNRLTEIKNVIKPAGPTPVTGTLAATGDGTEFVPASGRPFNLVLFGEWEGTVTVQRQFDGTSEWHDCTFVGEVVELTANSSEVLEESEDDVKYRLHFERVSGTLSYRISQ